MKPDSPSGEPSGISGPWQPRRGEPEIEDRAEVLSDRFGGEMPDEPAEDPAAEVIPEDVAPVEAEADVEAETQLEDSVEGAEAPAEFEAELEVEAEVETALEDLVETEPADEARAVPSVEELCAEEGEIVPAAEPMRADPAAEILVDDAPELSDPVELARVLMAVLLSSRESLKIVRLAEICNSTQKLVKAGLEQLEHDLREQGFPLELLRADDSVRLMTAPVVFPYLERLRKAKKVEKLSPAALETLAVIAYRQPVIRAEVEAIRGVKVGPMLRSLLEHKLVKITGRADVPGRPLQYGTSQQFLDRFGLNSLKDLPSVQEFRSLG